MNTIPTDSVESGIDSWGHEKKTVLEGILFR